MMFFSPLEQFEVQIIVPIVTSIFDISVTNATIYLLLNGAAINTVFNIMNFMSKNANNMVKGFTFFIYNFIFNILKQQTGKNCYEYIAFYISTFLFILFSNLIGLFPFGYTITAHILITFVIAFSFNIGFIILGIQKKGIKFFSMFVPSGVPIIFIPLITVIEIVSYLLRTFSLSIRLFANMMAGHTLLHILSSFCFVGSFSFSILPWLLVLGITILEVAIAFIQSYVFVILLSIYLNDSIGYSNHLKLS